MLQCEQHDLALLSPSLSLDDVRVINTLKNLDLNLNDLHLAVVLGLGHDLDGNLLASSAANATLDFGEGSAVDQSSR
jgi:hypothetical protein